METTTAPSLLTLPADAPVADGAALLAEGRFPTGFALFLLVNATLFIRPAEIAQSLEGLPIYNVVICLCLLASWPVVLEQLAWRSLRRNPITLCVLGLLPAIALSQLSHGNIYEARIGCTDFVKVVFYYLLLVGLVDSVSRLRTFLITITACVVVAALISVCNFHGIIHLAAEASVEQHVGVDEFTGQFVDIPRIQSLGIFADPNDFALVLVTGMLVLVSLALRADSWTHRLKWLAPMPILGYTFAMTQSRGGFLAMAVGLLVLFVARWGWRRAIPLLVLAAPAMLLMAGGRQLNINMSDGDTGMGRVELWSESLVLFHHAPIFGIGIERLPEEIGLVSHNTYVHCFAELGMFGATCFIGAMYLGVWGVRRFAADPAADDAPDLLGWRSCVLAIVAAYAMGIFSLSRPYSLTTYMILGTGAAFLAMAGRRSAVTVPASVVKHVGMATIAALFFLEVFVRVLTHHG